MVKKIITKLSKARFKVLTPNVEKGQLILNFNPLIEQFNLTGNYQLVHWQAMPKKYREWGIYSSVNDSYQSLAFFEFSGNFKTLQIHDTQASSIPTAVLLLEKKDG